MLACEYSNLSGDFLKGLSFEYPPPPLSGLESVEIAVLAAPPATGDLRDGAAWALSVAYHAAALICHVVCPPSPFFVQKTGDPQDGWVGPENFETPFFGSWPDRGFKRSMCRPLVWYNFMYKIQSSDYMYMLCIMHHHTKFNTRFYTLSTIFSAIHTIKNTIYLPYLVLFRHQHPASEGGNLFLINFWEGFLSFWRGGGLPQFTTHRCQVSKAPTIPP